ncbi:hypothetical protein AM592_20865 [Bacillus gobiensis]|uniref:Uncharacterized protein n=1 Tax=Bacillus gobiensis TaxID=1441095 RepID=A0A0M4FU53_9BACI|nr:hypothetical protein AM592_20865 [Bacillus gobiensis]
MFLLLLETNDALIGMKSSQSELFWYSVGVSQSFFLPCYDLFYPPLLFSARFAINCDHIIIYCYLFGFFSL